MPNRTIRDGCRSSEALDSLSAEAERMFWRLITVADDFGRFDARPVVMLVDCFKLMAHSILVDQVKDWYEELENTGLVNSYIVDSKVYGVVMKWGQKRRASFSKYPDPPWDESNPDRSQVKGKLRTEVFTRDGYKCLACLIEKGLSVDHIISTSKGGTTVLDNLQTLCVSCNSAKRLHTFNLVTMDSQESKDFTNERRKARYLLGEQRDDLDDDLHRVGSLSPEVRGTRYEVRGTRNEGGDVERPVGHSTRKRLPDAEFLETLKHNLAYEGINIDRELLKCRSWLNAKLPGEVVSQQRFINWLNRAEKPMSLSTPSPQKGFLRR